MTEEKTREEILAELEYNLKVNDSLRQGISILEKEIEVLKGINQVLSNEKEQWSTQKSMQNRVMQQTMNNSNAVNQAYLKKIHELKQVIQGLKNKLEEK
jgi:hypothetical protein